jgi:hypothetical protein
MQFDQMQFDQMQFDQMQFDQLQFYRLQFNKLQLLARTNNLCPLWPGGRVAENKQENKRSWGRCYDHNFLRFLPIFWSEKMAFF